MVKDKIDNIKLYQHISRNLTNAIDTVLETDFLEKLREKGRIDGDGFFVTLQEYETKAQKEGRWETHRKYIDIQYVITGQEMTGYTDSRNLGELLESNQEKDFYYYKDTNIVDWLTVRKGEFVIFFPTDGHKPSLCTNNKIEKVEKVVFKVQTE